jgi:hypothetical protein
MVVIMIIPIAVTVPAITVHVPPLVGVFPAVLPRFAQFHSGAFRLLALISVVLDCFVQTMICPHTPFLALVIRFDDACAREKRDASRQR